MTLNFLNFTKDYPDEESCKLKYKELRDQIGVLCFKCSRKEHYGLLSACVGYKNEF